MPAVNYLKSKEQKQAEAMKKNTVKLKEEIGRLCFKYDLTKSEFAKETGINESTFYRRIRCPEELTVGEMYQIKFRFGEFNFAL